MFAGEMYSVGHIGSNRILVVSTEQNEFEKIINTLRVINLQQDTQPLIVTTRQWKLLCEVCSERPKQWVNALIAEAKSVSLDTIQRFRAALQSHSYQMPSIRLLQDFSSKQIEVLQFFSFKNLSNKEVSEVVIKVGNLGDRAVNIILWYNKALELPMLREIAELEDSQIRVFELIGSHLSKCTGSELTLLIKAAYKVDYEQLEWRSYWCERAKESCKNGSDLILMLYKLSSTGRMQCNMTSAFATPPRRHITQ